jgi:hypothetical protein
MAVERAASSNKYVDALGTESFQNAIMATNLCGVIFKLAIPYYYSSTILGGKYIHSKIVKII